MAQSLRQKATQAVIWSAIERFSVQGVQFIVSIIIARLLMPSEYGLIAMLSIFLAVAQTFIDSGFSNALIQKQNRTETDFSTVFFFNLFVGCFFYAFLFLSAPYIAQFYHEPLLDSITKIVALNLIVSSLGIVQRAKLSIVLNFRLQAVIALIAVVISGVTGVVMAYQGYGAWALVIQSLLNNFMNVVLLWIFARWYPRLVFSWKSFMELFAFGSKLLLSGLLHTLYTNLYSLFIGKKMSSTDLGIYNRSYTLALFPSSNITDVLHKAMFPVLCSMQDDEEELERYFLKYLRQACFIVFPLMVGLAALASPFIETVLSVRWMASVPILQILAFAYMWDPVMRINNHFLYAKGRTDYTLKAEIIKKIVAFSILVLTISMGLYIIALGVVLYSLIDIFIITRFVRRVSHITLRREMKALFPIWLLSMSMGIIVYGVTSFLPVPYIKLIVGIPLGMIVYYLVSLLLGLEELKFMQTMLHKRN